MTCIKNCVSALIVYRSLNYHCITLNKHDVFFLFCFLRYYSHLPNGTMFIKQSYELLGRNKSVANLNNYWICKNPAGSWIVHLITLIMICLSSCKCIRLQIEVIKWTENIVVLLITFQLLQIDINGKHTYIHTYVVRT